MDFWGGFDTDVAVFSADQSGTDTCRESSDSHGAFIPAEEEGSESWNISNFQHRVEGSADWDTSHPRAAQRVQDLSLNMSISGTVANNSAVEDRCQLDKEQKSWPFDNSPCRMFGTKKNARKPVGRATTSFSERSMFKGWFGRPNATNMTPINESSQEYKLTASRQNHSSFDEESETPGREMCSRERYQIIGASKSFDNSIYGTNTVQSSVLSPKPQRPAVNRAMSVNPVRPPDATGSQTQCLPSSQTNGRRRSREATEGTGELSTPERPRQLLKLLRDNETVQATDFMQLDNRRVLHHIVYQSKLMVSFSEMDAFLARETARNETGQWERPPLPLFAKD